MVEATAVEPTQLGPEIDSVHLTSLGIDIGSTTSHLLISELWLERDGNLLSSRFEVVDRKVTFASRVILTPFSDDGTSLDAAALEDFIKESFHDAGVTIDEIDTGAVILTGVALERENARKVAELFATQTGKFVCATAGHTYEALLAAHGSGVVALSKQLGGPVLNIDIGGGTTKYALADDGHVVGTLAIAAGARLVVVDDQNQVIRTESPIERYAAANDLSVAMGEGLPEEDRRYLAKTISAEILSVVDRAANSTMALQSDSSAYWLAGELPPIKAPTPIVFSGGVSEFMSDDDTAEDVGDLGRLIAMEIRKRYSELPGLVRETTSGIRATVLGASQYTAQLSGNTIHISNDGILPIRNLPVALIEVGSIQVDNSQVQAQIRDAVDGRGLSDSEETLAIFVSWDGPPNYDNLRAMAEALLNAHVDSPRRTSPLIAATNSDIAGSIGRIISAELEAGIDVIIVDGLDLTPLDFVDLGERLRPSNTVPVVIKTLVLAGGQAVR